MCLDVCHVVSLPSAALSPGNIGLVWTLPHRLSNLAAVWTFLIFSWQIRCCPTAMNSRTTLMPPKIWKIFSVPKGPVQFLEEGKKNVIKRRLSHKKCSRHQGFLQFFVYSCYLESRKMVVCHSELSFLNMVLIFNWCLSFKGFHFCQVLCVSLSLDFLDFLIKVMRKKENLLIFICTQMHILLQKQLSFKSSRKLFFLYSKHKGEICSKKNQLSFSLILPLYFPSVLPRTFTECFSLRLSCSQLHT